MGFKVIVSERLPTITDKNSNANCRSCRVFVPSGLYLGTWQDIKTEVLRRPELSSNPWDINTMISFGAYVGPASSFQLLDYLADLEWHNNQDSDRSTSAVTW